MKRLAFLITLLAALTFTAAGAVLFDFQAVSLGSNVAVPNVSLGSDTDLMLNDLSNPLTINETFAGLSAPAHPAHIPCCGLPGVTAAVHLPSSSGFPITTSGAFIQTYNPATPLNFGGGLSEGAPIAGLKAGLTYSDIDDVNVPGGEIPGQRIAASTPEPSTWAMLLIGFAGIGFAGYRNLGKLRSPHTRDNAVLVAARSSAGRRRSKR